VCCSVLQCVAVCCSVLQCVAVCCSVLQCVEECSNAVASKHLLRYRTISEIIRNETRCFPECCIVFKYVAVCVAVCSIVLQFVVVGWLERIATIRYMHCTMLGGSV